MPSHRVPQFGNILMRVVKRRALAGQLLEGHHNHLVLRTGAPGHAQQDVGINQTRSDIHLVVILVNPFAGDCGDRETGQVRQAVFAVPQRSYRASTPVVLAVVGWGGGA
jgi:hypothetical protein